MSPTSSKHGTNKKPIDASCLLTRLRGHFVARAPLVPWCFISRIEKRLDEPSFARLPPGNTTDLEEKNKKHTMMLHLILLWALVGLIGQVDCKCSIARIADDERSIAYACTHGDLNDLDEISSDAEWIEFTASRFHYIPDNAFRRFKNLQRLSFYNCHVDFIAPDAFAGLNRIEWLTFHGTKIHVARSAWFRHLTNLRKLVLDRCGLVHIEPDVFRMLRHLETLRVHDNDLDCLATEDLAYLGSLRSVRIDENPWLCECRQRLDKYFRERSISLETDCFREIYSCKRYQCMIQTGFRILPTTFTTHNLNTYIREWTSVRGNEFQTSVFTSLDRLPDKTSWIEITGLTIDKLPRYGFFRFGNSLRSLDLRDCRIREIEDGAFAGLHKLQRLSLVGNHFRVVGVEWFRDLLNLQQLILQSNEIEQIDRTALWRVGNSLRNLDLRNNRLRCIAIEELAELKKLERFDATGNPWLCSCRRNLQSFLTQRTVGFEIDAGKCYENEKNIPEAAGGWHQHQTSSDTSIATGRVHWKTFEDSVRNSNVTIVGPRPPPSSTKIPVATPQSVLYTTGCLPQRSHKGSTVFYTCREITSIEALNVVPKTVYSISVIRSKIKKVPESIFDRFDGYLSKLELRDCGIEKINPRAFLKLYNLEYLSLRNNELDAVNEDTLQGLSNLKHLDLSHNIIYRIENGAFDNVPKLNTLDVSENFMNCIGVEYMAQRLQYLSSLNVTNNPWSCLCGIKLTQFLDARGIHDDKHSLLLREDCYATNIPAVTTAPPPTTIPVPAWNKTVEGTCVTIDDNAGIRYRCIGANLPMLQSLTAEVVAIEFHEGHLPRLPAGCLSKFQNLRELIITNSGLTTIENGAFDGVRLQNLTIQDNPLKMIGSSWFLLKNLERLDLRGNSIKYVAPGAFRRLTKLEYLNLEGNDLKCIFTSDLNEMPQVYIVEFSGNPLKWRCRVELEQFLEARKIHFVRIENSCEGKKLVRNLLLQNKTDGSFDCPSDCSPADQPRFHRFLVPFLALPLMAVQFY